jgi:hypothetical protein
MSTLPSARIEAEENHDAPHAPPLLGREAVHQVGHDDGGDPDGHEGPPGEERREDLARLAQVTR